MGGAKLARAPTNSSHGPLRPCAFTRRSAPSPSGQTRRQRRGQPWRSKSPIRCPPMNPPPPQTTTLSVFNIEAMDYPFLNNAGAPKPFRDPDGVPSMAKEAASLCARTCRAELRKRRAHAARNLGSLKNSRHNAWLRIGSLPFNKARTHSRLEAAIQGASCILRKPHQR